MERGSRLFERALNCARCQVAGQSHCKASSCPGKDRIGATLTGCLAMAHLLWPET
jgi:hypothetical protein